MYSHWWIALAACFAAANCATLPAHAATNGGYVLGWPAQVRTHVDIDSFVGKDHTLIVRVMPRYVHGAPGPWVSNEGAGTYTFGQGDYRNGNGDNTLRGDPVLTLQVGDRTAIYLAPGFKANQWHDLVAMRKGKRFSVFLDGMALKPVSVKKLSKVFVRIRPASEIDATQIDANTLPKGALVFGRHAFDPASDEHAEQAYGVLDRVVVFSKALSASELQLWRGGQRTITGNETGLFAAWHLNTAATSAVQVSKIHAPVEVRGRAVHIPLTGVGDFDTALAYSPDRLAKLVPSVAVPLPPGRWKVAQGYDNASSSHNGTAAYCYDFAMVSGKGLYPLGTNRAPVPSAEAGKVVRYYLDSRIIDRASAEALKRLGLELPEGTKVAEREGTSITVQSGDTFHTYLHLGFDTIPSELRSDASVECRAPGSGMACLPQGDQQAAVRAGQILGTIGPQAAHLHFCGAASAVGTPMPIALRDLVVRVGGKAKRFSVGIPLAGQVIDVRP